MSELSENQIKRLRALLQEATDNLNAAEELITSVLGDTEASLPRPVADANPEDKVVEGVFDGQNMIGHNGKTYPVPANYASKSKLVQGDVLKLTIAENGKLLYKQIDPAERKTIIGTLVKHDDQYFVEANGKEYRVLYASITYFRIKIGDQVSIAIPAVDDTDITWAAIISNL
jgi:hypothetical protein